MSDGDNSPQPSPLQTRIKGEYRSAQPIKGVQAIRLRVGVGEGLR